MNFALLLLAMQLSQPFTRALRCDVGFADGYYRVHGYSPDKDKPVLISMRLPSQRMKALKDCDKWLKEQEKPKKKAPTK